MTSPLSPADVLIVCALEAESEGRPEQLGFQTLYTGVGKLNAATSLLRHVLQSEKAEQTGWVLNLGTAGSQTQPTGTLVFGHEIKQHDMDVRPLGLELGVTPFDDSPQCYTSFENEVLQAGTVAGLVATGDRFVTEPLPWRADAIDMEAYALALVCHRLGIRFSTLKYISDGADEQAEKDWPAQLHKAAVTFEQRLTELCAEL